MNELHAIKLKLARLISTFFKSDTSTVDKFDISEDVKKQNREIKINDLGIFTYNNLGFDIDLKEGYHSIKWTDIERLEAYKVDLMTTDEVCMDITFDNKTITITEETKGWYQFIDRLEHQLSHINADWQALVLKTPFEYDLTTIYERADRTMPPKSNFYSVVKNKIEEDIIYFFQKNGWTTRKTSMTDYELKNSWTELTLEKDNGELLLHGLIAYHPNNVAIIRQFLDSLHCAYKFELYNDSQIVEQTQNGM
jgi:hypothetical protein